MAKTTLTAPTTGPDGEFKEFELPGGSVTFIIGPNGAGKSSLLFHIHCMDRETSVRIPALRQSWLAQELSNQSVQNIQNLRNNMATHRGDKDSLYRDLDAEGRISTLLHDIPDRINERARSITEAVDAGDQNLAASLSKTPSILHEINKMLADAGFSVTISIARASRIMAHKNGAEFSIQRMSDGERSAFLLLAEVALTAEGRRIVIDEPEQHLHQAVLGPLLSSVRTTRPDLSFVIATHDLRFVDDTEDARIIVVHGSEVRHGAYPDRYDFSIIDKPADLDEDVRRAVLGGRRKILVVEGTEESLDTRYYRLLFPGVSIVPGGDWKNVEKLVAGLRGASQLHWVEAFGIIDGDQRTAAEREAMTARNIHPLDGYSIESLYYHRINREAVAAALIAVNPRPVADVMAACDAAILDQFRRIANDLFRQTAVRRIRQEIETMMPTDRNVDLDRSFDLSVDAPAIRADEKNWFDIAYRDARVEELIGRYRVKSSGVPSVVTRMFGLSDTATFEEAVLKRISSDAGLVEANRKLLGPVPDWLNAAGQP